jgi:hypothetical protein
LSSKEMRMVAYEYAHTLVGLLKLRLRHCVVVDEISEVLSVGEKELCECGGTETVEKGKKELYI